MPQATRPWEQLKTKSRWKQKITKNRTTEQSLRSKLNVIKSDFYSLNCFINLINSIFNLWINRKSTMYTIALFVIACTSWSFVPLPLMLLKLEN
jgi:hypothetical protein